ncbi:DUF4440 domain-containing protein [Isoptericola cucumis]|uniref:DUF4440 domain-containing protein n=1 Tax=Isoptericola cucumis TaxID=1776856 RepID=A0ABQ2B9F9_9MICO|nr:DUF4440 domain-containing protein [Isoptericola cucumis]GGI09212.1 hypothetical protein GCM10007368_25040 [Isoptericola cucumis]
MDTDVIARDFFDRYSRALLDRDASAVADLYAVPALILFPGQSVAVSDRAQTEQFFASAMGQYDGVTTTTADVRVVAATGHSIWAEVAWHHGRGGDADRTGEPDESFVYQLVDSGDGWRIAVLTPLVG